MAKCSCSSRNRCSIPYNIPDVKPGDYPLGSLLSRGAARALASTYVRQDDQQVEEWLKNLTPLEQAFVEETENPNIRVLILRLLRVAQDREMAYGKVLRWPTAEEIRHNRAVRSEVVRIFGGEALSAYSSDSWKWNGMTAIAEKNLRAGGK
jgi:hypothetical protein